MGLNYGVLKGMVAGHLRDADDDHYQILVHSGTTVWRIACNVRSAAPNAPSTVLFRMGLTLPEDFIAALRNLESGFERLPSEPGGLAIDYIRSGFVKPSSLKPLEPDMPGEDNDLKDRLESATVKALAEAGSRIYAFGDRWGPQPAADKYFQFVPSNGVHDIHMNQGNNGKYIKDDGVFQDGALVFDYPDGKFRVFFFAFQSQYFDTDDVTGHAKNATSPVDKMKEKNAMVGKANAKPTKNTKKARPSNK